MSVSTLATSLVRLPGFRRYFDSVLLYSVRTQYPRLNADGVAANAILDWSYLITCASVLAQSRLGECEDFALRIAQAAVHVESNDAAIKDAACVILDMLSNRQAIELAERRSFVEEGFEGRLPLLLSLEATSRAVEYAPPEGLRELRLNRFQKDLWDNLTGTTWLSVSAPTSTGKSFAIANWLEEFVRAHSSCIVVYVVPTRALIQQVEFDLKRQLKAAQLQVNVSCFPINPAGRSHLRNVYVFTQERLQLFLNSTSGHSAIDVLIIDEAHKVGDGARGILLEQVIDAVIRHSPTAKVVFLSPLTSNPELLVQDAPQNVSHGVLASQHVTVNQNLIWVSQVRGNPLEWQVELCRDREFIALGKVQLPFRPSETSKRLPFVAYALAGDQGGNIVYANRPSDAEKAAQLLADLCSRDAQAGSENVELSELADLVRKTIHPRYALAEVLRSGVAFHYGNMPLLVRNEIERLFKEGHIRFLVCTSTLIEGVNLPCRNIFVRGPKKGVGRPMNEADFWNLAGRAGRLGREFQGSVVCVDPRQQETWQSPAPKSRGVYPILQTSKQVLSNAQDFIKYVRDREHQPLNATLPEYEHFLSFAYTGFVRDGSLQSLAAARGLSPSDLDDLTAAFAEAATIVAIPLELLERNPGISPFAMEALLNYFVEYADVRKESLHDLLPVLPESEDAVDSYLRILQRINTHLASVFQPGPHRLAILIVNWMRGHSLSRLIATNIAYQQTRSNPATIAATIRTTMADIENFARFLAPKFTSCYLDVLSEFLRQRQEDALLDKIPDLNVWLEFGASQGTQLSLMSLGMSRTSATTIAEIIADDGLDEAAAITWLNNADLESMDVPRAVIREAQTVRDLQVVI